MDEHTRRHRRHRVRARCIARSSRDGRLLGDTTLDVSYSGVRIAALGGASIGERVEVSLEVPGTRIWIEASGRVERVVAGLRAGDGGRAIGVRLDRMDGMRRLLLAASVSEYPEAGAGRGRARDYARAVARIAAS
jgi:hypothetical protein